ncbi:hypothetical protein THAOC_28219 [Thalassiosira oceanica]|uniref:Uncharacterized protein n=1 Tax=Thalassiosira oceanica TaxID=159749 RepID=K0RJP6_THAOC|nr:hypothetical protein THAOC_28219 [Thalassiosira oceanica]|eukprot:EJK52494.1 hypothetical protein THAOC_28219 [Thalassiosira oceanica]
MSSRTRDFLGTCAGEKAPTPQLAKAKSALIAFGWNMLRRRALVERGDPSSRPQRTDEVEAEEEEERREAYNRRGEGGRKGADAEIGSMFATWPLVVSKRPARPM